MKKLVLVGAGIIIVVGVAAGALVVTHKSKEQDATTAHAIQSKGYKLVSACDVLRLQDVKQALGAEAKASESNGIGDTESDDVKVTNCTYTLGAGTGSDFTTVGLLARVAKTKAGAESNKAVFASNKPAGINDVQKVPGFGDAAFWDQSKGQLNILRHSNWYIVSKLVGAHPDKAQLSDVEQLAKLIVGRM